MRKRKRRERRRTWVQITLGATATTVLGVALAVAVSYQTSNGKAGDTQGAHTQISPRVAASVPVLRLPLVQAPAAAFATAAPEPEGATGSGTTIGPVAEETPSPAAPTAPTGIAGTDILTDRTWLFDMVVEQERLRQRAAMIARIDGYLVNRCSPMQGLGWAFYDSAARYSIDPRLSVAIAEGESNCGKCCFAPHNAWGMLAYRSGFCSWEEGINANLDWLHRYFGSPQTAYDCPGYCVPDYPWMDNVERVRRSI